MAHAPQKSASLTVFYFDQGPFTTLVQNAQLSLKHTRRGYDKVVLLKSRYADLPGKIDPDVIADPTSMNFFDQIKQLARDGYYIDLYVFVHGNAQGLVLEDRDDVTVKPNDITLFRNATGLQYAPIRMVYQMNCYGYHLFDAFRNFGAKAVCGAKYVNFYPNMFNKFAENWNKGNVTFKNAIIQSNTASARSVMQGLIQLESKKHAQWRSCNVLKKLECAKRYFIEEWFCKIDGGESREDQWQDGKSGKENMNHSSWLRRVGSLGITKNTMPTWPL